ncbi:MAG TPA: hypothetical protein VE825_13795 [Terriglobales bacterium]|jgi:hypothetical protein|nr:hypothetical protein [Terriglobales bacterium]
MNWRLLLFLALVLVLAAALPLAAQQNKGSHSAGITASDEVSAQDLGLPLYPGSHRYKDSSDDSSAVQLGLWGKDSGFKLVVLKLESDDSADKVAAFYRKALAKYGKVLDCGDPKAPRTAEGKSSKGLTCDADEPKPGEQVFKSGSKEKQHLVGIQSSGGHTLFQLVYLEQRGVDDGK